MESCSEGIFLIKCETTYFRHLK